MNYVVIFHVSLYFVIVRVIYALQKTKYSMREQSILILDITISEVLLPKLISKYARLVFMTIYPTDMMTKSVLATKFELCSNLIGVTV